MSAITGPRTAPRGFALRAFANEAGKGLRLMWRHRAITITAIVLNGFLYLMIQFFIGGGHLVLPVLALTLPGLFAYAVASTAALQGSGGIAEEVNGGTLEQAHLSPAPPSLLVADRLAALAIEGLIPAIVLVAAFGFGYGPHWVIRPDALVPLALTIADGLGYGLLMTALTLRAAPSARSCTCSTWRSCSSAACSSRSRCSRTGSRSSPGSCPPLSAPKC